MRNEEERSIDGETYTFYQLGAIKAHSLLLKIGKIIGPAFGQMADSTNSEGDKSGIESMLDADINMSAVIDQLMDRAEEATVLKIITTLLSQVTHDGEEGTGALKSETIIDTHFKGRLPHMYKVIFAAAEVQYGDFFAEGGMFDNLKAKAPVGSRKK